MDEKVIDKIRHIFVFVGGRSTHEEIQEQITHLFEMQMSYQTQPFCSQNSPELTQGDIYFR